MVLHPEGDSCARVQLCGGPEVSPLHLSISLHLELWAPGGSLWDLMDLVVFYHSIGGTALFQGAAGYCLREFIWVWRCSDYPAIFCGPPFKKSSFIGAVPALPLPQSCIVSVIWLVQTGRFTHGFLTDPNKKLSSNLQALNRVGIRVVT